MTELNPNDDSAQRSSVMSISIRERAALYASYMSSVIGGGLFLPTTKAATMGDTVVVILQLLDSPKRFPISGKVVWITPAGTANRAQGIGIQLTQDEVGSEVRLLIEQALGSAIKSSRKTHTL